MVEGEFLDVRGLVVADAEDVGGVGDALVVEDLELLDFPQDLVDGCVRGCTQEYFVRFLEVLRFHGK